MNKTVFKATGVFLALITIVVFLLSKNSYALEREFTFIYEEGGQLYLSISKGEETSPIHYFGNNIIASTKMGWVLFDSNGKAISPPYEEIKPIFNELLDQEAWESEYYFAFVLDGKCGLMDKKGKVIIKNQFEIIDGYSDGILSFMENGDIGLINLQGDIIVSPQPGYFSKFRNGVAIHSDGDAGYSAINRNGDVIIAPEYKALVILENGYVMAYTADINQQKKVVYDSERKRYDEKFGGYSPLYNTMFENIKWGLYDNRGNLRNSSKITRTNQCGKIR